MSVNSDLRRAKEMRGHAKAVSDGDAKESFLAAAARLEKRAASNARKVGRKRRRTTTSTVLPTR